MSERLGGKPGPPPRREAERRRRNKPDENAPAVQKITADLLAELPFEIDYTPEPPELLEDDPAKHGWHPAAQELWRALQVDPARKWMTSADWAMAQIVCESLSRDLREQVVGITEQGEAVKDIVPMKGANLNAYLKFMSMIGITEAARLRIQKEITLFPAPNRGTADGKVVDIDKNRRESVQ